MKEKLSAFIDAELSEHEERQVLQSLKTDAELCQVWERYHLIRAAMTRQLEVLAPDDLVDRVRTQVDQHQPRDQSLGFWSLAGGFTAAAVLAAVAIFTVQGFMFASPPTASVATEKSPVAAVTNTALTTTSASAPTRKPASPGERLNVYLVGHNEFMPTTGMSGMLPYARVVTYDINK